MTFFSCTSISFYHSHLNRYAALFLSPSSPFYPRRKALIDHHANPGSPLCQTLVLCSFPQTDSAEVTATALLVAHTLISATRRTLLSFCIPSPRPVERKEIDKYLFFFLFFFLEDVVDFEIEVLFVCSSLLFPPSSPPSRLRAPS